MQTGFIVTLYIEDFRGRLVVSSKNGMQANHRVYLTQVQTNPYDKLKVSVIIYYTTHKIQYKKLLQYIISHAYISVSSVNKK